MPKKTRRTRTQECALCGGIGKMTREHVPPRCLFLKPRPQNTITVPLCSRCNHSYHLDDEYFRVMVAAAFQPSAAQWRLWREKVVGSSFSRSGGLKARLNEHCDLVQQYAMDNGLELANGIPLPQSMVPLLVAFEKDRINRIIDKIVRCLHFRHQRSQLRGRVTVEMTCPENKMLAATIAQPSGRVGHADEFLYRFEQKRADYVLWCLVFYRCHIFLVHVLGGEDTESCIRPTTATTV